MVNIKQSMAIQAVKRLLPLISVMPDEGLKRLSALGAKIAPTEYARYVSRYGQKLIEEKHPSVDLFKRGLTQMNSRYREKIIVNLGVKHTWYGEKVRDEVRSQGIHVPFIYLMSPTMRCNLRCTGCYASQYDPKDDLPLSVIDRVLSEGKELGLYLVIVLGGEPFIRDDMWQIYEKHEDITFIPFTNGTLLNEERVGKMSKLGNIIPMVSIEGFEKETDARRGKGIFSCLMETMDRMREEGIAFGFSSMVTPKNIYTLISDEFIDLLIQKGCLMGWHFLYIPVGKNPDPDLMPTAEQREILLHDGARRIRSQKSLFVIDFWNDAPYVGGCIAGGRHFFHINSKGDVEPCIFVHFATDNIKEKSLREVLSSNYFRDIQSRQPYSPNLLRPCMIIDHPQVLREVYQECHPYPTHEDAELLLTSLCGALDQYSDSVASIFDPIWEEQGKAEVKA
jgi:MoaA/NifB/PqqE/SkfB family radical SAM enzyme